MAEFDLVIRSGNVVTAELASQKADLFQPISGSCYSKSSKFGLSSKVRSWP
jgi:hypothetical protein